MAGENCENNSWFSCSDKRKNLGWWATLRLMIIGDYNGCPALRVKPTGDAVSTLTKAYITGATDALKDAALATWMASNQSKTIVHIFNTIGDDGKTGITILYK